MFVRKAALRPVPSYATVEDRWVQVVEQSLDDDEEKLQESLDRGFRELDARQPAVARHASETLSEMKDELAQALGYFLAVTVYLAFREAFPKRLGVASEDDVAMAEATLDADEELRIDDPAETLETDDIVAMGQPAIVAFVQHHVEQALEQGGDDVDVTSIESVYRAVLVEIVTLSHAVLAPEGIEGHKRTYLA